MTMTPYERLAALLDNRLPDRVPVYPLLLMQGAQELGLSLQDYLTSGQNIAEGQLRLLEKYGHDCVYGFPHVVEDITAFGVSLTYHQNGPPSLAEMAFNNYHEFDGFQAPDPASSPLLIETLRAIEILAHEVKGQVPILGACIAPFSLPSMLIGTEKWMDLLLFESEEVRVPAMQQIISVTTEFCVAWANMQLAAGADTIVFADGMASASVINRRQFIEYALPVIKNVIPQINGPVIHEGVGDLHPMLDLLMGTGIVGAIISCNDDLNESKAVVGNQMIVAGNLNNIEMRRWSVQEMQQYAQAALEAAAPGGGFILAPQGPEIPLGVADEIIRTMVEAAHNWSY